MDYLYKYLFFRLVWRLCFFRAVVAVLTLMAFLVYRSFHQGLKVQFSAEINEKVPFPHHVNFEPAQV